MNDFREYLPHSAPTSPASTNQRIFAPISRHEDLRVYWPDARQHTLHSPYTLTPNPRNSPYHKTPSPPQFYSLNSYEYPSYYGAGIRHVSGPHVPSQRAGGAGLQTQTSPLEHQTNQSPRLTQPGTPPSTLPHTHVPNMTPAQRSTLSFFMSDSLRSDLHRQTSLILQGSNPDDSVSKSLPPYVHTYHSIWPLEPNRENVSKVFSVPTTVYKAISRADGLPYALRQVSRVRFNNYQNDLLQTWKMLRHPGIITLRDMFMSKQLDNNSCLFFAYDYHPGAETLEHKYLDRDDDRYIPEETLWSFIIQISSALKAIHGQGLTCHMILPSKILETGKNRIRINCVGMEDTLFATNHMRKGQGSQKEDIILLGKLILSLACNSKHATKNIPQSLDLVARCYSSDLKDFLETLLGKNTMSLYPSIDDVWKILSPKLLNQIDSLYGYTDMLESELSKELENGRLFRLLAKLGFINERPEYENSSSWSETGDRYLLKLFRDYTFHQVYEDGNPVIDFAHVVECLNKLDVGVDEKILLTSRDEKSMLVLSYKDLKRCMNEAFNELMQKSNSNLYP